MSLGPQLVLRTTSNNDKRRQVTKDIFAAQEPFPRVWAGQRNPPDSIRRTGRLATIPLWHNGSGPLGRERSSVGPQLLGLRAPAHTGTYRNGGASADRECHGVAVRSRLKSSVGSSRRGIRGMRSFASGEARDAGATVGSVLTTDPGAGPSSGRRRVVDDGCRD
jgi:hypothetical protein